MLFKKWFQFNRREEKASLFVHFTACCLGTVDQLRGECEMATLKPFVNILCCESVSGMWQKMGKNDIKETKKEIGKVGHCILFLMSFHLTPFI
jgi:hypothetical protein